MPATLLVIRHGETAWNVEGRWQGWTDIPLTVRGRAQAAEAAASLGTFDQVRSSDLSRAADTARAISSDVVLDPRLREFDVGEWTGLDHAAIEVRWPGQLAAWHAGTLEGVPGGERRDAFVARIEAALHDAAAAAPDGRILVVTHGGVLAAVRRRLGAEPVVAGHLDGELLHVDEHGLRLGAPDAPP